MRDGAVGRYLLPAVTLAVLVAMWQMTVVAFNVPALLLPTPFAVAGELVRWRGLLLQHSLVTLSETVLGFLLGVALGVPIAVAISTSRLLQNTIYPLIILAQSIPKVTIAPLFLIWLGYGILPKIFVGFLVAFFPIVIDTATGLNAVEPELLDLTRALSATEWQTLWRIRFPQALPFLFSGLKVSITLAVIGAVIGEFVGANQGLGYLILDGTAQFKTAFVFACMLLLSLIGIGLFGALAAVERLLIPWHASQRSHAMGS
jgi:NitT/TauT family transport system permease protein